MSWPIYDMQQTWNNGSTVFNAIKMDVIATAFAAGSKLLDLRRDGLAVYSAYIISNTPNTSQDGFALVNPYSASSGNQQYSPRIRLTAQGWKTDATAASQTVDWKVESVPQQNTSAPINVLTFSGQVNAGGYQDMFSITHDTVNLQSQFNITTPTASWSSYLKMFVGATQYLQLVAHTSGAVIFGTTTSVPLRLQMNSSTVATFGTALAGQFWISSSAPDTTSYFQLDVPSGLGGAVAAVFSKGHDATNSNRWDWGDCGGFENTDAGGGAFWRGFHVSSPTINVSTSNMFPRMSMYFSYDVATDPTYKRLIWEVGNVGGNYFNFRFNNDGQLTMMDLYPTRIGFYISGTEKIWIDSNSILNIGATGSIPSGFGLSTQSTLASYKSITPASGSPSDNIIAGSLFYTESSGDNANYMGAAALWAVAADKASITSGTKGVLNGLNVAVVPKTTRNNSPFDDVVGIGIYNNGTVPGTDAIYLGSEQGASKDWDGSILEVGANASNGIGLSGTYDRCIRINNQPTEAYFLGGISSAFNDISIGDVPYFQIHGNESSPSSALFCRWTNDSFGCRMWLAKSRSTAVGTSTGIVQSEDTGGQVYFGFDDGTEIVPGAAIISIVDGTPGTGDMPTRLDFRVSADGAASPTSRFTIKASGRLLHSGLIFNETRYLTGNHTLASATATEVTDLQFASLDVGTYVCTYYLVVQSSSTSVGIGTGVNFTGSLTQLVAVRREATTATSTATGVIDDISNTLTGQHYEARATKNLSTTSPDMVNTGVATANSNVIIIIEVIFTVSVAGDLELWHSSETATNTSIMAGSCAILNQFN